MPVQVSPDWTRYVAWPGAELMTRLIVQRAGSGDTVERGREGKRTVRGRVVAHGAGGDAGVLGA